VGTPDRAIDVGLLGPVRLAVNGVELSLAGLKRRVAVAVLIANRNRVVSTSLLADAVWGDELPSNVAGSVQVLVSGLRKLLDDTGLRGSEVIETAPPGYRLRIDPAGCDIDRFHAAREDAATHRRGGRLGEAAALYRSALGVWRGPACDDLTSVQWAADLATGLNEERVACHEAALETELAMGRYAEACSELAVGTAQYPLRESMWALYLTALYGAGRQGDALAGYARVREILDEELGVEPGQRLRELHAAILAQRDLTHSPPEPVEPQTIREAATAPPARLEFASGSVVKVAGNVAIGRSADNDVTIADGGVSRRHAQITPTTAGYVLRDLGSTNGTYVNDEALVGVHLLVTGDEIRIGPSRFVFRID
jgi:DNA-binding SARP family transcriptional activator